MGKRGRRRGEIDDDEEEEEMNRDKEGVGVVTAFFGHGSLVAAFGLCFSNLGGSACAKQRVAAAQRS